MSHLENITNLALTPHVPGHGSMHFSCLHALLGGQSVELIHSGLQAKYGSPKYSGMHWHAAALLRWLQSALDPQGVGLHGSTFSVGRGGPKTMEHFDLICIKQGSFSYVLALFGMRWRDLLYSLHRIYILGSDWWPCSRHGLHTPLDRGPYTCYLYRQGG